MASKKFQWNFFLGKGSLDHRAFFPIAVVNKLAQIWWFNTKQAYFLIALEVRSLKWFSLAQNQNSSGAALLPEAIGENPFPFF